VSRTRAPGLTVVTPWLEHPEFIPDDEHAVTGAQVILIDNGSTPGVHTQLYALASRLGGVLVTNPTNRWFAAAINQGLDLARTEAVVILNNDIATDADDLVARMLADILAEPDSLHGPSQLTRSVDGIGLPYLEGWCIGAHADVWQELGGLDEVGFPLPYWEDNDLCLRAVLAGYWLHQTTWPIRHLTNGTARGLRGSVDGATANQRLFERRARDARPSLQLAVTNG
jgi:GT2 family glycosyltransferase